MSSSYSASSALHDSVKHGIRETLLRKVMQPQYQRSTRRRVSITPVNTAINAPEERKSLGGREEILGAAEE
jgi:hypothetical protein